jgi:hypothetical protein
MRTVKTMERTVPAMVRMHQADLENQLELFRKKAKPWADVVSAKAVTLRDEFFSAKIFFIFATGTTSVSVILYYQFYHATSRATY